MKDNRANLESAELRSRRDCYYQSEPRRPSVSMNVRTRTRTLVDQVAIDPQEAPAVATH